MAGEIRIQGDLKFIGYKQIGIAGSNGQVLSYFNGNAVWSNNNSAFDEDRIITTNDLQEVIVDRKGNVIVSQFEQYFGIDTKSRVRTNELDIDISFTAAQWTTESDGTDRLKLVHNFNSNNLIIEFFEDDQEGSVFVPWRSTNRDIIEACIPTGNAFSGKAKIIG